MKNSAKNTVKPQIENSMKQGRKCCETAMKRYYETAPIINNNNTVKVDFIPLLGTMN
jgi:hypothetical protein